MYVHLTCYTVPSVSNMAASAGEGKGRQSGAEAGPSGSGERRPKLPSFWVPSLTPAAKATEIKKPVSGLARISAAQ